MKVMTKPWIRIGDSKSVKECVNKLVSVHFANIKRNQDKYLPIGSRCP